MKSYIDELVGKLIIEDEIKQRTKQTMEKLEKLVGKLLLIRAKYEKSLSTCEAYIECLRNVCRY